MVSRIYQSIFSIMSNSTRFTYLNPFYGITLLIGTSSILLLWSNIIKNNTRCIVCGKNPPCNTNSECKPQGLGYITYYFINKNKCLVYN
jgi:ABC-type transport system involved in multi-copper enzyme maturation permease subunit